MERLTELDIVVLTRDLPNHGLENGDVGTVVHSYSDGDAAEVEFVTGEGDTVAVVTLKKEDLRQMRKGEILHAREIAA